MKSILALALCCAAVSACTLTPKYKPNTSVTPPAIGHPSAPSSVQAADASEAFSPYQGLGFDSGDSLAPGMSFSDLRKACMADLGYSGYSDMVGGYISLAGGNQPFGSWGYLGGAAEAEQNAFQPMFFSAIPKFTGASTISAAEGRAMGKCFSATSKFTNAQQSGPLALITTLDNDIQNDVQHDPAVKSATDAWAACMAQNGYHFTSPQSVGFGSLWTAIAGRPSSSSSSGSGAGAGSGAKVVIGGTPLHGVKPSASQIATAVTDADCTQSTDLGGIWFAVQASYEQQFVNLNQQALTSAVTEYRTAYQQAQASLQHTLGTHS
jgi:hypothetical protein